jgi:crotonobetainyl-CoA:carnitine CoA-transferase CaiB-like acyl-CoA transferase
VPEDAEQATGHPGRRRYACSEGAIEIAVESAEQWHALAVCLGRPELAYEGSWQAARKSPADGPLAAVVASMFAEDTAERWQARLEAHGVPSAVVA